VAETLSGTTWSAAIVAPPTGDPSATLNGVSCVSATSCVSVGYSYSAAAPVAETLSGTTWSAANLPPPLYGLPSTTINGVSCVTTTSCVAVGYSPLYAPVAYTSAPACVPGVLDNCVFAEATPFAMDAAPVGATTQTLSDIVENVTTQPQPITDVGVFNASNMPVNGSTDSGSVGIPGTAWPESAITEFTLPAGDTCAGTTLAPGATCDIPFAFHPTVAGSVTDSLCLNYTAGTSIGDCIGLDGTTTAPSTITLPPGCAGTDCPGLGTGVQVIPTFDARNKNISPAAYPFGIEAQILDFVPQSTTAGTVTSHSITITNSTSSATTPFALGLAQGTVTPREYAISGTTCPASGSDAYPYGPLAPGASCTVTATWTVPATGTPYTAGSLTVESDIAAGPSSGSAYGSIGLLADNQVSRERLNELTPSFAVSPGTTQILGTPTTCTTTTCTFALDPSAYGGTSGDTLTFTWSWSGTDAAGHAVSGTSTTTGVCDAACAAGTSGVAIPAADATVTLPESAPGSSGAFTPYEVNLVVTDTTTPGTVVAPVLSQALTVLPSSVASCPSGDLSLAATSGSEQSTAAGTAFADPLVATVTCDATTPALPVLDATVTFTAPSSSTSASGTPAPVSATTTSLGAASTSVTANEIPGAWDLTANASLGSGSAGPVSYSLTNTVGSTPTTTTVTCTPDPSMFTNDVACTSKTVETSTGHPVTAGAVTIESTATGTPAITHAGVVNSLGEATLTTTDLPIGSNPVDASYSGDGVDAPSQGATTETVTEIPTSTSVSCSPNPAEIGTSVPCTATVTATVGPVPLGPVTISTSGGSLGTCTLAQGTCVVTATGLTPGTVGVTANYPGSTPDAASHGTTTHQTSIPVTSCASGSIVIAATSGSGQATHIKTVFGAPVVATVTCDDAASGVTALVYGATVAFTAPATGPSGSTAHATVVTGAAGTASTTVLADAVVGGWNLTGAIAGATATPGAAWALTNSAWDTPTTTTVTCSPNPTTVGTTVTCTSVTVVTATLAPVTSGAVTITAPGGISLGVHAVSKTGQVTVTTASLAAGSDVIEAAYGGTAFFGGSTGHTTEFVQSTPPSTGTTPPSTGTTPPSTGTTPPSTGTTPPSTGTTPPSTGTTKTSTKKSTPTAYRAVVPTTTSVTCSYVVRSKHQTSAVTCIAEVRTQSGRVPPGGVLRFAINGSNTNVGPFAIGHTGDHSAPPFRLMKNGRYEISAFYSGTHAGTTTYLASVGSAGATVNLLVCLVPNGVSTGWFLATGLPWILFIIVGLFIAFGLLLRRRYVGEDVERDLVYEDDYKEDQQS